MGRLIFTILSPLFFVEGFLFQLVEEGLFTFELMVKIRYARNMLHVNLYLQLAQPQHIW